MAEEKKSISDKAKDKVKDKAKQLGKKILAQVAAVAWAVFQALLPIIIAVIIATVLASAVKWFLDWLTGDSVSTLMQGLTDGVELSTYIKVDENRNLVFTKDEEGNELKDVILQEIKDQGMDPEGMGLTTDNLIQDLINAEIVTNYPYLGGDGLQGIVNFYRRDYDEDSDKDGTLMMLV